MSDWKNINNKLVKEFTFPDFNQALEFVKKVSLIAEKIGHHPEIWFTWGKVKISTTTHDAGNTITKKDEELSQEIDKIS